MVFFDNIEVAPPDAILGVALVFAADQRPSKINLGVGTYKGDDLKPLVLNTVKKAEKIILDQDLHKEYLPIEGEKKFLELVGALVFGEHGNSKKRASFQTVGGTAALRVGADFLKKNGFNVIALPDPTWDNHRRIFTHAGFEVVFYPYYEKKKKELDFSGMKSALTKLPEGAVVLLQGCCHNPTGFDPTFDEWKLIAEIVKKKELLLFFDFAYQGFGEGLEQDAKAIRHFVERELEIVVATSYSKNFGLYAERTGALFFVCPSPEIAARVESQVKVVIRGIYSNPPCHGARIVSTILSDPNLKTEWQEEVSQMRQRISQMRADLVSRLLGRKRSEFAFMRNQKGMFSYTGLEEKTVEALIRDHGIYMPKDGRINVAGINKNNLEAIVEAIVSEQ